MPRWLTRDEFGIGDHLGIEEQPEGIVSRDLMPELDEPHQFSRLIGAGQVGVGVAHDPAVLLLGEEAQDAGTGLAAAGQVVILQGGGIAPERDGVEVQGEGPPLGEQERGQGRDPTGEEALLMIPLGAIGVLGGISGLGQDVQAGEEAQALITVEVADMAPPLLIQELQGQQAQQGAGGRDHLRAGIARLRDEVIEAELGQQRQEQEDARDGGAHAPSRLQVQASSVGHLGQSPAQTRGLGPDVRGTGRRKRGWRARAAPGSELVDHLAQGVVGVSELGGDLLEGPPLDEVGPQRLIASVEGVVGLQEVAEAGGVVHDRGSEM